LLINTLIIIDETRDILIHRDCDLLFLSTSATLPYPYCIIINFAREQNASLKKVQEDDFRRSSFWSTCSTGGIVPVNASVVTVS